MLDRLPEDIERQLDETDRHQSISKQGKIISQVATVSLARYGQSGNPPLTEPESQLGFFAFNACYSASIIVKLGQIQNRSYVLESDLHNLPVSLSFPQQIATSPKAWKEVSDMISAARTPDLTGLAVPAAALFAHQLLQVATMGFTCRQFEREIPKSHYDTCYPVYSEDRDCPDRDIGAAVVCRHRGKNEYYAFPKNIELVRD